MDVPFEEPDWSRPLDLPSRLALVPARATVNGLLIRPVIDRGRALGGTPPIDRVYLPFRSYAARDALEIFAWSAGLTHPREPRRGIWALGRETGERASKATLGRVLLAMGGDSLLDAMPHVVRFYQAVGSVRVALIEGAPGRAVISVANSLVWPEYHLGTLGWIAERFESEVRGRIREHPSGDFDVELRW
ncbi:MAG: DUF2378 family protein [Sandaracinaceae bacterium]|nr:DUF2378 family protein [Sandaracinaceae bacterium]